MLIVYDMNTKEIKGVSLILNDTSGKIKGPTIQSSFPSFKVIPNMSGFEVPDDDRIANELYRYELKSGARGRPAGLVRKTPSSIIELSTDAKDQDGDGIPEIRADGTAQATITASIRDVNGRLLTSASNLVRFETTGGRLSDRNVKCKKGVGKTTLQSVKETLTPVITAYSDGCKLGQIKIAFL